MIVCPAYLVAAPLAKVYFMSIVTTDLVLCSISQHTPLCGRKSIFYLANDVSWGFTYM
jgi:hypothetical protein